MPRTFSWRGKRSERIDVLSANRTSVVVAITGADNSGTGQEDARRGQEQATKGTVKEYVSQQKKQRGTLNATRNSRIRPHGRIHGAPIGALGTYSRRLCA